MDIEELSKILDISEDDAARVACRGWVASLLRSAQSLCDSDNHALAVPVVERALGFLKMLTSSEAL